MEGDLYGKVRDSTSDLMKGLELELVDVEVAREGGRLFLRLSVDRPGGVTVDDCARASEMLGDVLEREDLFDGPYQLEVMSPGLRRALKRQKDFARSTGKRARVKLRQPFEGSSTLTGYLRAADVETFDLDIGTETLKLRYDGITGARLDPQLPW